MARCDGLIPDGIRCENAACFAVSVDNGPWEFRWPDRHACFTHLAQVVSALKWDRIPNDAKWLSVLPLENALQEGMISG